MLSVDKGFSRQDLELRTRCAGVRELSEQEILSIAGGMNWGAVYQSAAAGVIGGAIGGAIAGGPPGMAGGAIGGGITGALGSIFYQLAA